MLAPRIGRPIAIGDLMDMTTFSSLHAARAWSRPRRVVGVAVAAMSASVIAAALAAPAPAAAAPRPSVSTLSVRSGSTGGGTRVRVDGHGLGHVTWVEFGTARARIVARPSASSVVVVSPAHGAGTVHVRVRTAGGTSATVTGDRYRYQLPPVQVDEGDAEGSAYWCARSHTWTRCWGGNTDGELGNGTAKPQTSPHDVKGLARGVRDISTGAAHTCAVTASRGAVCWGWEGFGLLGNGVSDSSREALRPVGVHGLSSGVRSIVAGDGDSCVVTTAGALECWGSNSSMQLGTGVSDTTVSAVPVSIAGLSSATSVAIGNDFICALTTTGAVYCWGSNNEGQLGAGSDVLESATPLQVRGLSSGVRSLSAGGGTACAVTGARAVRCWGSNVAGELGNDQPNRSFSNVPVAVTSLGSGQATVAVGLYQTACAMSTAGRVRCWGYNYDGTLGNGTENDSPVPVQVKGVTSGAAGIDVGEYGACALTRTGQVMCWGYVEQRLSDVAVTLPWYR